MTERILKGLGFATILIMLIGCFTLSSCRRPEVEDNAKLSFSTSTVTFDTVFTTVGSATRRMTVHNPHNFAIKTDIILAGGGNSYFSINVDGVAGNAHKGITIPPKDSLFIFVKVNVNPGNQNTPFLITDSILFRTGTTQQDVDLVAYGQDANFIVGTEELGSIRYKVVAGANEEVRWTNEKPYVIYGMAVVDSLGKLIIEAGTKIYCHQGAGLWVYRYGNIEVNGTLEDPVRFQGDRLESAFLEECGVWDRIWINEGSQDNVIRHAIIKGAYIGLQFENLEGVVNTNKNIVENTLVCNTGYAGLLGRNLNVEITNCQFSNSAGYGMALNAGNYNIKHVTIANYYNKSRNTPALDIANYYDQLEIQNGKVVEVRYPWNTNITMVNTIVYGYREEEIMITTEEEGGRTLGWQLSNCLIKTKTTTLPGFVDCLFNQDPRFDEKEAKMQKYKLTANSPAIGKGKPVGVQNDILGNSRNTPPDIGAYEYVAE